MNLPTPEHHETEARRLRERLAAVLESDHGVAVSVICGPRRVGPEGPTDETYNGMFSHFDPDDPRHAVEQLQQVVAGLMHVMGILVLAHTGFAPPRSDLHEMLDAELDELGYPGDLMI